MISHHHKTLFVHIPKCGGQSIETAFLHDLDLTWETRAPLLLRRNDDARLGPPLLGHLTLREYLRYRYLTEEQLESYFSFAVVRNPFARVISLFNYLKFAENLSDFVQIWLRKQFSYVSSYEQENHGYKGRFHFVRPQRDFVTDADGDIAVKLILPLEDLAANFPKVRAATGLSSALPHVNASPKRKATTKDLDDASIAAIHDLYHADFEAFGYPAKP